jgi:hypothetical protein
MEGRSSTEGMAWASTRCRSGRTGGQRRPSDRRPLASTALGPRRRPAPFRDRAGGRGPRRAGRGGKGWRVGAPPGPRAFCRRSLWGRVEEATATRRLARGGGAAFACSAPHPRGAGAQRAGPGPLPAGAIARGPRRGGTGRFSTAAQMREGPACAGARYCWRRDRARGRRLRRARDGPPAGAGGRRIRPGPPPATRRRRPGRPRRPGGHGRALALDRPQVHSASPTRLIYAAGSCRSGHRLQT